MLGKERAAVAEVEQEANKRHMEQGLREYFAEGTHWCQTEFNQRWIWVLQTRKYCVVQIYLPSASTRHV